MVKRVLPQQPPSEILAKARALRLEGYDNELRGINLLLVAHAAAAGTVLSNAKDLLENPALRGVVWYGNLFCAGFALACMAYLFTASARYLFLVKLDMNDDWDSEGNVGMIARYIPIGGSFCLLSYAAHQIGRVFANA